MSHDHDHHDEPAPEFKDFIPFFLIACAVFAIGSCSVTQSGLKKLATEELSHESGYEQVAVSIKGNKAILSGHVETAQQKEDAEDLLSTVEGLAGIAENNIEIGLPEPSQAETAETEKPTNEAVVHKDSDSHAPAAEAHTEPQALVSTDKKHKEDARKHAKDDEHASSEAKHAADSSSTKAEQTENPWVAELIAKPGRNLNITAIVTSQSSNKGFIKHARTRLDEIRQEIVADERIQGSRVRTYLQADLTDKPQNSSIRYNFTFKE